MGQYGVDGLVEVRQGYQINAYCCALALLVDQERFEDFRQDFQVDNGNRS